MMRFVLLLVTVPLAFGGGPKLGSKIELFNGKNLDNRPTTEESSGRCSTRRLFATH